MARKGPPIAFALLAAGFLLAAAGFVSNAVGTSQYVSPFRWLTFTPNTIGPALTEIRWTAADAHTTVDLVSGPPNAAEFRYLCQSPWMLVAQGSGASGTITTVLSGGSTYTVYACAGNPSNPINGTEVTFTIQFAGLTLLTIAGAVIAICGAVFLIPRVRILLGAAFSPRRGP